MEQWMNLQRIKNAAVEKSGGLDLAEPVLMAGRLADEIWARL